MYSAKEAAEITGLSTATLRYYEKESLLPPVKRNVQKYRQYTCRQLIEFVSPSLAVTELALGGNIERLLQI